MSIVLANWGGTGKVWAQGDFNYDGMVNASDFSILTANWRRSPSPLPPQATVLARLGAAEVGSNTEQFVACFSSPVTGVSASDFAPQCSGTTATVRDVEDCSPSHAVYLITVSGVYGNGTLGLNFADTDGSVEDYTTLVALPAGNRSFSESDQPYSVSSPFVWVGGTDNCWYTSANWQDGIRPLAGSSLLFAGAAPSGGTYDDFPGRGQRFWRC